MKNPYMQDNLINNSTTHLPYNHIAISSNHSNLNSTDPLSSYTEIANRIRKAILRADKI